LKENDEKYTTVKHQYFYECMEKNSQVLSRMVLKIAEFLKFLSYFKLVHGDLRPANVFPVFDEFDLKDVKIGNFTSSFEASHIGCVERENSEYSPPEVNKYFIANDND